MDTAKIIYDDGEGEGWAGGAVQSLRSFTIVLSAERPAGALNWLRLQPEPREAMFIVRQTFGDKAKETAARLSIRLSDRTGARPCVPTRLTATQLDEGLQSAAVLVAGASAMFAHWAHGFQSHTNELPLFNVERSNKAGGDPNIRYYHSYWRLAPHEALRIRVRPPPCRCWNFQLNNHVISARTEPQVPSPPPPHTPFPVPHAQLLTRTTSPWRQWMESLDYRYHSVHTNSTLAKADAMDRGAYTIIVAHQDPNADGTFRGNWIETVGHSMGTMCFRWVAAEVPDTALPHPQPEVVPFASL